MSYRILFVDDEAAVLDSFRRSFCRLGFDVFTAESARLALELLAEVSVDVVVSDDRVGTMSGSTFLSRVRRAHPDTIRILLTEQATIETVMEAISGGKIYRLLSKPVAASDLARAIRRALSRAHPEDASLSPASVPRFEGELESRHPGITSVRRDSAGAIVLSELPDHV